MRTGDVDLAEGRLQGPAWRAAPPRGRRGVGLLWGAAAVLILAAAAVLLLPGGRQGADGEVPLIVADEGPMRVRPAAPGGLRVPNQDTEIYPRAMQRAVPERRVEVLLPPPEAPKPLPQPAASMVAPAPPRIAPEPTAVAAPSPPAPAVAPAERPVQSASSEPARPSAATGGPVWAQLAAVTAEAAVQPEIARLRSRLAPELGARALSTSRIERDGRPIWRIRAGGFADEAAARAFCDSVRARGFGCLVVTGS